MDVLRGADSAGPLDPVRSCRRAVHVGRTRPVPENVQRQLALGGADVTSREPDAVAHAVLTCLGGDGEPVLQAPGPAAAAAWEAAVDHALDSLGLGLGLGLGSGEGDLRAADVVDLRPARGAARAGASRVAGDPW